MGASLASESRLSRFGGPARRVVSLPEEDDLAEGETDEALHAPMSPISGERWLRILLTLDAQEDHLLSNAHASVAESRPEPSPPHRRQETDFSTRTIHAPRSPPHSVRISPPPLTDTGKDNWLASHHKADTAKRKGDDPDLWTRPTPSSNVGLHGAETRPLRASQPAPPISSIRAQEQSHVKHSHQPPPQPPQQQWVPPQSESSAKPQPPAPPQAVPKRSFLVSPLT